MAKRSTKPGGEYAKRKKQKDIAKIQESIDQKLGKIGRDTSGKFIKGNPFRFKHGNTKWTLKQMQGQPKVFEDPQLLLEAFEEYVEYVRETPWMRNELVKGGDMAGMVMEVPTARPITLEGFTDFVGLTHSWWRSLRARLKKSDTEADRVYATVVEKIDKAIYNQKYEGAAVGAFNANIIARDLGLVDKKEIEVDDKREETGNVFPFEDDADRLAKSKRKNNL